MDMDNRMFVVDRKPNRKMFVSISVRRLRINIS